MEYIDKVKQFVKDFDELGLGKDIRMYLIIITLFTLVNIISLIFAGYLLYFLIV